MRRHKSGFVTTGLAAVLGISSVPDAALSADALQSPVPAYNPYPPGILPPDLASEIARVQREVRFIFNEALNEWRQLPRPTLAGNPPTLRGSGYEAVEILGKLLNFDLGYVALPERSGIPDRRQVDRRYRSTEGDIRHMAKAASLGSLAS